MTKKIEKKTAVAAVSIATDSTVEPLKGAARVALDSTVTALEKPAKTPATKASPPPSGPASPSAAATVEAAPAAAELKPAESKPSDRPVAPPVRPGKASTAPRQGFKPHEFIVYPAHGVGQIVAIEEQEVAGFKLELFVISFIKDKMILKVPTPKVASVGMRKLADADVVKKALDTLTGRARVKRTMWSRRAQEYEAKINSGDLIAIAEVVRDLYRSDAQPEQSYSERQLYEAALDRMAREVVVVQKLTESESLKAIEAQLQKGPRRGKAEEIEADEADIEEAA
ncbi:CarD family transcriptional regulator [Methylocapsa aurea]|uniref:CarD family transcriptional regulator n=1 Tax=Methylocapsa aurea TaxID=663610 RepID=UPI001FD9ED51|nr:CarD family transcriptional regulator [Methylocapsa aurea]